MIALFAIHQTDFVTTTNYFNRATRLIVDVKVQIVLTPKSFWAIHVFGHDSLIQWLSLYQRTQFFKLVSILQRIFSVGLRNRLLMQQIKSLIFRKNATVLIIILNFSFGTRTFFSSVLEHWNKSVLKVKDFYFSGKNFVHNFRKAVFLN